MPKVPKLIFMYGYPASGKTTYARNWVACNPQYEYLSADDVRNELYGSPDHFGDPEEIYRVLLDRMLDWLRQGRNVIYDACNLYQSFRMDYLRPIQQAGISCYKTIVRMNTVKTTCLANHAARDRDFDIGKIGHYFDIGEPPTMEEGWDHIRDVADKIIGGKQFYVASPFSSPYQRQNAVKLGEALRAMGHSVVLPMEHKLQDAYAMPNHEWGLSVYKYDVEAIRNADFTVCLSYGRQSTAGTNWEAGYAHGIGKPVFVVEMPGVYVMSLMLMNGCSAVFKSMNDFLKADFNKTVRSMDLDMEQK